jgi:hypothetical protein
MDYLDLLQWPAMVVTVLATGLVASTRPAHRRAGFWVFIASNVLWVAWGWHTQAYALIALQFCLAAMNVHGARTARRAQVQGEKAEREPGERKPAQAA